MDSRNEIVSLFKKNVSDVTDVTIIPNSPVYKPKYFYGNLQYHFLSGSWNAYRLLINLP